MRASVAVRLSWRVTSGDLGDVDRSSAFVLGGCSVDRVVVAGA
jgi:hypothetical protein